MTQTLLPNLGAEEGPSWRGGLERAEVRTAAGLWRLLFAADARMVELSDFDAVWPSSLGPRPDTAVFPWLGGANDSWAWLATDDDATRRVHDKAFAQQVAGDQGLEPRLLRGLVHAFDRLELEDAAAAAARIDSLTQDWPAFASDAFVLKPRWGTSGRGRVKGRLGAATDGAVLAALPRLATHGGAILEPWLRRTRDLSTQLHVGPDGLTLIGSLEQVLSSAGAIRGHRGELDSRGRVTSGLDAEEPAREAAVIVAAAAGRAGFIGPCGVDAFEFDAGDQGDLLRPVVELNARFTMGLVTIGLVKRALTRVKRELQLQPGERRAFYLGFDAPQSDGGWDALASRCPEPAALIPLRCDGMPREPALLIAANRDAIDRALSTTTTG